MTITVKSCGDCPLSDGAADCIANLPAFCVLDYYLDNTTHPSCPLRTEKITVELENTVTLPQKPEIWPNCD